MRRLFVALLASLILAGFVAPAAGAAATARAAESDVVPKVVIIVGPSGGATDRYRSEARKAAALARKYTPDVTEIYSPNATWPAVKAALQGASVVVYMGHGNGWPSKYRDALYPPTQNGFGLNPKAGSGDSSHQYFGEARIAKSIRLAKNAVVLLNHLCYASGNSEPGLAEGTLDQARQRVDNFAAGFIKAGAAAVVAEAYASPNHMLRTVLEGKQSIDTAWRRAPSRNGNAFAFESVRSAGFVAQMDPERDSSGFTRSIVLKAGLASADVLRNARGSAAAGGRIDAAALAPSLIAAGIQAEAPRLAATTAETTITYKVPYSVADRKALPKTIMASVRWDALEPIGIDPTAEVEAPTTDDAATTDPDAAADGATTENAASAESSVDPAAAESDATAAESDATAAEADPAAEAEDARPTPPDLGLVTAERLGDVVAPVKVKLSKSSFSFKVKTPAAPGRYRLTVTLHDKDGVAFDAATQALLPTLIVRVTGDLDAAIVAPPSVDLVPGTTTKLDLWVGNLGTAPWGHGEIVAAIDPEGEAPATAAELVGHWVPLAAAGDPELIASAGLASMSASSLPAGLIPGAVVPVTLTLTGGVPAGEYLLLLDIVTPEHGSLVAAGMEPALIRVRVAAPETAPTAPAAGPDEAGVDANEPGTSGEDATESGTSAASEASTPISPAPTAPAATSAATR